LDHKLERNKDVARVKDSPHPKKVVVAGPGTGKSYLFSELIKKKRKAGKSNFLAITFIGKLGDALADELCGLAETMTMHGFARHLVLRHAKGWNYYPKIHKLIKDDLKGEGIKECSIGDENYRRRTKYYRAVGEDDVVYYAVQICKRDPSKIPSYDLVLVDEYQDFNEIESALVDLLAQRNEIVIVGDDDQALYTFKGSSPSFIRKKYATSNKEWESFTLRFCSRCTEVIIKYFHALVAHFNLNDPQETDAGKKRIEKEYICYLTGKDDGKDEDSRANPKIHLVKNCPPMMIAYKIRTVLEELVETQKIKDVLVVAEGQSGAALLKAVTQQLRSYGFKNVDSRSDKEMLGVRQETVEAYKLIAKDESSILGWRILGNPPDTERDRHLKNARTLAVVFKSTPSELEKIKDSDIRELELEVADFDTTRKQARKRTTELDSEAIAARRCRQNEEIRKNILIQGLKRLNQYLQRPLSGIEITICNILNSKGLGADVVFLIGFDQGKFPAKATPNEGEIYQMLVAVTRAKKKIYLINTIKSKVSQFCDCLDLADLDVEEIQPR
jgi:superfamily I DNA/RNA helicase